MASPYDGKDVTEWPAITQGLIARHPLKKEEIVETVLKAWDLILKDTIIGGTYRIGIDLFPTPQIMGDFLHELVPLLLERKYPQSWRRDRVASEKDMVYVPDDSFSVEIKTSSQKQIYGNRSFSQEGKDRPGKKLKSGYYLAINFPPIHKTKSVEPIKLIRFGWLDHGDWGGQVAPSGQQANLSRDVLLNKLVTLYPDDGDIFEALESISE